MRKNDSHSNESFTEIKTKIFKADRKRFAMLLIERHGQAWIFGGFFLFIVAVILGLAVDYRIFIMALLLVCLVAPALLMILYYNYGMKGENFLNVLDHRIEIDKKNLTLFLRVKGSEEPDADADLQEEIAKNDCKPEKIDEWREYSYPFTSFGNYSVGKDYVVFRVLEPKQGFLYLPAEAFDNQEDFSRAVKRISKRDNNEDN